MINLTFQAREEIPFLKKFANDWPTKVLAMQLLKNKRGYSYRRGYLEVPEKYSYLKDNVTKKKPQGGGSKDNNTREDAGDLTDMPSVVASGSKSKRSAPATAATQQPRKKKKTSTPNATMMKIRARPMANSKGKQKACSIGVEDEDEDEDNEDEDEDKTQDGEVDNEGEDVADQE